MPSLNWIGKDAVVSHQNDVPIHLLPCNPELSVGKVWEKASADNCVYVMPRRPDFELIQAKKG
jgi:hypothetical protein